MHQLLQVEALVKRICLADNLKTYDPYDVWKTKWGFCVKDLYNCHPWGGLIPAALLTLSDTFLNNTSRWMYSPQEYPIVRALAVQCLLNLYVRCPDQAYMDAATRHLDWLKAHACTGTHGLGWGLQFRYAVAKNLVYDENTPFSTMTPYVLEAFVQFTHLTGERRYETEILGIYRFFEQDIRTMEETEEMMATSYTPMHDRTVINASSYAMWSFALLLEFLNEHERVEAKRKIAKLYRFIREHQCPDGSWLYATSSGSFIDCFHTCIVLKNLYKTHQLLQLDEGDRAVSQGYQYVKRAFLDPGTGLYRRFALANKPGLVRFDLYDNAEMLSLSVLLQDVQETQRLLPIIESTFQVGDSIYSQVIVGGLRKNKDMLRWAVMPYIYALSLAMPLNGAIERSRNLSLPCAEY